MMSHLPIIGVKFRTRLYFIWSGNITAPKLTCVVLTSGGTSTPRVVKRLLRNTASSGLREAHTSFKQVTVELNYERNRAKKWLIRLSVVWLLVFIICITSFFPSHSSGVHNFGVFLFITSTVLLLASMARFLFKRYQSTVSLMRLLPFRQLMFDGWIRTIRRQIQLEEEELERERITTRFMYQEKSKKLTEKPVMGGHWDNVERFYLEIEREAEELDPFLVRVFGREGEPPRSCTGREDIEIFSYLLKMDRVENFLVGPKYSRRSVIRDLLDTVSCDSISFTSADEDRESQVKSTTAALIDPSSGSTSFFGGHRLEVINQDSYDSRYDDQMASRLITVSSIEPSKGRSDLNTPLLGSHTTNLMSYFGTRTNV